MPTGMMRTQGVLDLYGVRLAEEVEHVALHRPLAQMRQQEVLRDVAYPEDGLGHLGLLGKGRRLAAKVDH